MHNTLQDELDELEGLRERADTLATDALAKAMAGVETVEDIIDALEVAAEGLEEGMTDLTTDAFRQGVEFARKRNAKAQDST